jgi:single-strand DNA-binding protein
MNKIWICGNISTELNLKEFGDLKLCEFSVAVKRDEKTTDFINCVVWNKQAENLVKYQSKGSKISVLGSLCVDKYQAGDKTRYKTYVRVNEIEFLGSKSKEQEEKKYSQIKATTRMNEDYNPELKINEDDYPW